MSTFDHSFYLSLYEDVASAKQYTRSFALKHFIHVGKSQGRIACVDDITQDIIRRTAFSSNDYLRTQPKLTHFTEKQLFYHWLMTRNTEVNRVLQTSTKAENLRIFSIPSKKCDFLLCIHLYPYFVQNRLHTPEQVTNHISQSSECTIYQKHHIMPHHITNTHFRLNHYRETYGVPKCSFVNAFYMYILQSMHAIERLFVRTNEHYSIIDKTVRQLSTYFVTEPSVPERQYVVWYEDDVADMSHVVIYAAHIRCRSWLTVIVSNVRLLLNAQKNTYVVFVCSINEHEAHLTNYYASRIRTECHLMGIPVVVLLDTCNKLFDFGKYWMGMHYINRFSYTLCTIMNDSVIVCDALHKQWDNVHNWMQEGVHMVGMLESSEIHTHYQSWCISMNPMVTRYLFTHMTVTKTHKDTVHINEVALGHKCLQLFRSKAQCSYETNLFYTNYTLHREYVDTRTLPFIKYKLLSMRPLRVAPATLRKLPVYVPQWDASIADKVLVSYVYFQSPVADVNFAHFIEHEVQECRHDVDYVVVIQGHTSCLDESDVLPTAQNWHIIRRPNTEYDFGGHAATLDYLRSQRKRYAYHLFMNSGVLGPFLTPEKRTLLGNLHWSTCFVERLNNTVKLVGTTIANLNSSDLGGNGPKVEGFCFATDCIGLECLVQQKTIFTDHSTKDDAIIEGEYGLSRCLFNHGYTIDCLIPSYEGVDWTNTDNHTLNNCVHPSRHHSFFGRDLSPYEVVMHKWYWHNQPTVSLNDVLEIVPDLPYQRGLGIDYDLYRECYEDLQQMSDGQAFVHWMTHGKTEGRVAHPL